MTGWNLWNKGSDFPATLDWKNDPKSPFGCRVSCEVLKHQICMEHEVAALEANAPEVYRQLGLRYFLGESNRDLQRRLALSHVTELFQMSCLCPPPLGWKNPFEKGPCTCKSHFVHRMGLNPEQGFHKHSLTGLHSDRAQFGAPPNMLMRILLVTWCLVSQPLMLGQAHATMGEYTSSGDWSHHEKNKRESSVSY